MRSHLTLLLLAALAALALPIIIRGESPEGQQPSFSQCKPYVDAALAGGQSAPSPTEDSSAQSSETNDPQENAPDDSQESAESSEEHNEAPETPNNDDESNEADKNNSKEKDSSDSKEEPQPNPSSHEDEEPESPKGEEDDSGEESPSEGGEKSEESREGGDGGSLGQSEPLEDPESQRESQDSHTVAQPSHESDSHESQEEEGRKENEDSSENKPDATSDVKSEEDQSQESGEDKKESEETKEVEIPAGEEPAEASSEESKEQPGESEQPAEPAVQSDEQNDEGGNEKEVPEEDQSGEEDAGPSYEPRTRDHLERILGLEDTEDAKGLDALLEKTTMVTLKELKGIYEGAIKPLETLYKYRDLSNRHFGDPEIFSKPMVVFMGPWSGGKSTIINWLLGIKDKEGALRTGADPSPAQFNIMVHGSEEETLDGTQLAADWTFSGLQKFGQAFLDRLRGRKLPNRLLEKVNLVEIPGILEVRKQVERSFPFNDACQWFIDRADILFLVYDPAKLDIGPETEAILDQLKGRESQVRIVLNKADSIRADELLRVQATLIWNISPLMASAEPPVMYAASLWDRPLQPEAPVSLLSAHEESFLKDIAEATEKRVETRIAAARRFAVRVRNHGKMCDCYLNTYNNHRSFFSNKKKISDDIIEHPQNYHIYEGLSTLTNISRYDLPDPDTYRDFFRLNPLWEFPTLSSTCSYFRGCPINKLDVAIAYELPELLGRFRRARDSIAHAQKKT